MGPFARLAFVAFAGLVSAVLLWLARWHWRYLRASAEAREVMRYGKTRAEMAPEDWDAYEDVRRGW